MRTLWTLPAPSTALYAGLRLRHVVGREFRLEGNYEDETERSHDLRVSFLGTEAYKCTLHKACSTDQITAYDKVIELEDSAWLAEVSAALRACREDPSGLRHLRIYVDDGPCYEFICRDFHPETT